MKNHRFTFPFLAGLLLLACSCPLVTATGTNPPAPAASQNTQAPAAPQPPAASPTPANTPTPTIPIAWPISVAVNCRVGPDTGWSAASTLNLGQTAEIVGKNAAGTWFYIKDPLNPGSFCWVAASVVNTAGNLSNLAIIPAPTSSPALVTNVTVKLSPNNISLPGCFGPVQPIAIKGTITVSGPVKIKYYFETQQGGSMPADGTNFSSAGSKSVSTEYDPPPGAGKFWVRLYVTSPNSVSGEASYKITCP